MSDGAAPMLERLWSGWRATYVGSAPGRVASGGGGGSVFTRILESGLPDAETHIVHRGELVFAIMKRC